MPIISQILNINNFRTKSAKSINLHTIRNVIQYLFKNVSLKAMLTLTIFDIPLFKGSLVLLPTQESTSSKRVKVSLKNQKDTWIFLKQLGKWLTDKFRRLQKFNFFLFCLTFSVLGKWKNLIFEMPIIPQI